MIALGAVLAILAGAGVALSMVLQRYALSYPDYKVPLCGCKLKRPVVWFLGFLAYQVGNIMFAASALFGPLSLLATLFTLLLVWNLGFSRVMLKETLNAAKISGAILIVLGAGLSVVGTPTDAPTTFPIPTIIRLVKAPAGYAYLIVVCLVGFGTSALVQWFERSFSLSTEEEEERVVRRRTLASVIASAVIFEPKSSAVIFQETPWLKLQDKGMGLKLKAVLAMGTQAAGCATGASEEKSSCTATDPSEAPTAIEPSPASLQAAPSSALPGAAPAAEPSAELPAQAPVDRPPSPPASPPSAKSHGSKKREQRVTDRMRPKPLPSPRLCGAMAIIYPMSLGSLEGVTQLTMKSIMSMTSECFADEGILQCGGNGVWWGFVLVFAVVGVLTIVWIKIVYTRFETTKALPIEYGTVHIWSVLGGVIFFEEHRYMTGSMMAFTFVGLAIVMVGVVASSRTKVPLEDRMPCCARMTAKVKPEQ